MPSNVVENNISTNNTLIMPSIMCFLNATDVNTEKRSYNQP